MLIIVAWSHIISQFARQESSTPSCVAAQAIRSQSRGKATLQSPGVIVTDPNVNPVDRVSTTSVSLLNRVRGQDQAAWERLVALYTPFLDECCRCAGLQAADTADVKQDVFEVVARKICDFRRDRPGDTFRGWIYTITRNKIRDTLKRSQTRGIGGSDARRAQLSRPNWPRSRGLAETRPRDVRQDAPGKHLTGGHRANMIVED